MDYNLNHNDSIRIVLISAMLLLPSIGKGQLSLSIDSLSVYDIIEAEPETTISEGFGEGPYIYGYFTLYNYTDSIIAIHSSDCSMLYYYRYAERDYSSMYIHWTQNHDLLIIKPHDCAIIEGGAILMIDVALHKSVKYSKDSIGIINHTEIFNNILPTLYAEIRIRDNMVIRSTTYDWDCQRVSAGGNILLRSNRKRAQVDQNE